MKKSNLQIVRLNIVKTKAVKFTAFVQVAGAYHDTPVGRIPVSLERTNHHSTRMAIRLHQVTSSSTLAAPCGRYMRGTPMAFGTGLTAALCAWQVLIGTRRYPTGTLSFVKRLIDIAKSADSTICGLRASQSIAFWKCPYGNLDLDAFSSWAEKRTVAPKSALGKAMSYLKDQSLYLINYLKDGRLEISNNRAERSIKSYVIDRKNFLFANTPSGATGSAVMFSLIIDDIKNRIEN